MKITNEHIRAMQATRLVTEEVLNTDGVLFLWEKIREYVTKTHNDTNVATFLMMVSSVPAAGDTIEVRPNICSAPLKNGMLAFGVIYRSVTGETVSWETHLVWGTGNGDDSLSIGWIKNLSELSSGGGGVADSVDWESITNKPDLVTQTTFSELQAIVNTLPTESWVTQKINAAVSGVYRFKGTVTDIADLPTENVKGGDTYNVTNQNDMNYAWVEPADGKPGFWDPLGSLFQISPISNETIQSIVDGTFGEGAR